MNIFKNTSTNKAFTLIELLVVISIIGLLSSIVLASLNTARAKARDAKRVSELKQLQLALELYRSDNSDYPGPNKHQRSTSDTSICPNLSNGNSDLWTTTFDSSFTSKYMSSLPEDPGGGCITYLKLDAGFNTGWTCTSPSGLIHPDGDPTGQRYAYLITFIAETDLSDTTYPKHSSWTNNNNRRCLLGPAI